MPDFERLLTGKRVFVTGHSGFSGSWLCAWFRRAGIAVSGYSLVPEPHEMLFGQLDLAADVNSTWADILDLETLKDAMRDAAPDVVIHLAAQPLVRKSYTEPLRTFSVNAQGTANVLEAARLTPSVKGIVAITTDKVYENREWGWAYRENDPLGGKDPYSASKAAAEMVIQGYRSLPGMPSIATARGGNIIGGGDFSADRLIPDFVRAVASGEALTLRYPDATRPWQHVLALVQGYGTLAAGLLSNDPRRFARAWNLGPNDPAQYSVRHVLELMSSAWERPTLRYLDEPLPEAGALQLDSRLAYNAIGWRQPWSVERMVQETAHWYREHANRGNMRGFTDAQIDDWRQRNDGDPTGR
ncbi:CDP-glucose 4,6-dehydratase [Mesorhizobium sp.]|uniref:CDP-glucose 4,6-dehydratase n=1 Tax=Mesorhizobium sp. TaxID=1871066 RepID=UPI000FE70AA3|nr:CDP-glucose 4,6-dehydratase [Mesorhizobium sp.]RWA87161.1 MAG: CDP-glucose 4,6-dehydratase [Mesorhizobium sp.]TIT99230.1 MAG: CDP-glucose 4,6-dehydratase [Mesorhizobium sp.]